MKEIILYSGAIVLVDDKDFDLVSQFHWTETHKGRTSYAVKFKKIRNKQVSMYMHRMILNAQIGQYVDHVNGNGLDNRRCNIRFCSKQNNQRNRQGACKNSTSKYLGVSWSFERQKWVAQINIGYKHIALGRFDQEENAAYAYNLAAIKHFGEFAHLNELPLGEYSATRKPRPHKYQSRKQYSWGSSKYWGVYWSNNKQRWIVNIIFDNKRKQLGSFKEEKDAALAYNQAVIKYHVKDARLNEL